MFTYVKLKNYKSLVDFEVDLTEKKDSPKKFILIYGENGVGKSNFASCFYTLLSSLMTRHFAIQLGQMGEDFDENSNSELEILKKINMLKAEFDIEKIIKKCKTNDSKGNMVLEFGFRIDKKNGMYRIETDNEKIISETLEYVYNKNQVEFFTISEDDVVLNQNVFKVSKYINELKDSIAKYWGKHSFLSLLLHEVVDKNVDFIYQNVDEKLFSITDYFLRTSLRRNETTDFLANLVAPSDNKLQNLEKGQIDETQVEILNKYEAFINNFFTGLYSDIKQAYYKKSLDNKNITYELRFKKQIYGNLVDVSIDQESTGTQNLLSILPYFIESVQGKTVIIDEVDTGIHDILMSSVIKSLQESNTGQTIVTTHNTMLLDSDIDKKGIYIFSVDYEGNKALVPLTDYEGRIHPNLNIRKRYLEGLYGGVPMEPYVEFDELVSELE